MVPQSFVPQVVGTQGTHLLLVQIAPVGQPPFEVVVLQVYLLPALQRSLICPHSAPAATQAGGKVVLAGQVQLSMPPQPSDSDPHVPAGKSVHFFLAHAPQVNVTASQTSPVGQLPQSTLLPQPSGTLPQCPAQETAEQVIHWFALQREPTAQLFPHATALLQASTTNPHALPLHTEVCAIQVLVLRSQT